MGFIEFLSVIRRQKVLVCVGLLLALAAAVFSSYRLDGPRLVSRSEPQYETTALVAITPGDALRPAESSAQVGSDTSTSTVSTTTTTALPFPTVAQVGPTGTTQVAAVPATSVTATTAVGTPLPDNVIDSRRLYYAALSIQTAIVSPGFAERVRESAPTMDGSIAAVVAVDTNTIRLVVDGSTRERASEAMNAALNELAPMVRSYATSDSVRFTLDVDVLSGPSTPSAVSSIKAPLIAMAVLLVALGLVWMGIRAVDFVQLHRRETEQLKRAEEMRVESDQRRELADDTSFWPSP